MEPNNEGIFSGLVFYFGPFFDLQQGCDDRFANLGLLRQVSIRKLP